MTAQRQQRIMRIAEKLASLNVGDTFVVHDDGTRADLGDVLRRRVYRWRMRGLNRMSQRHSVIKHTDSIGNYYVVTRIE